ncbi:hypothetical protein [Erythrobacter sp. HL-111]|uniref:hypothetical protein n=1 Tax=Erythrobacter sp. HL-111 TaxID=1798193 RepID=UPI0006DA92FE|nr:hypothetical protein [Erythrobacter sp. HL-111]KPP92559.1 MAG: hypothetical protein HLUCCO15_07420 [Erythrobacteraceae bacterium HL-111]SDS91950.1 hypothetical protein SAMN04515621_2512 [Erythrobacter sp. HL-111]
MTAGQAGGDGAASWQLVLADLALILFLVTLAALAGSHEPGRTEANGGGGPEQGGPARFAPSQALYRAGPDAPPLDEWLARQERDPRATLTIYARHDRAGESAAWAAAQALSREARAAGAAVRVVIEPGEETALHASLGYDGMR